MPAWYLSSARRSRVRAVGWWNDRHWQIEGNKALRLRGVRAGRRVYNIIRIADRRRESVEEMRRERERTAERLGECVSPKPGKQRTTGPAARWRNSALTRRGRDDCAALGILADE